MGKYIPSLRWVFGIVFLFTGFGAFKDSFISALAYIGTGSLLIPPLANGLYNKLNLSLPRVAKATIIAGLLITAVQNSPKSETLGESTVKTTVTITPVFTTAPTQTPIKVTVQANTATPTKTITSTPKPTNTPPPPTNTPYIPPPTKTPVPQVQQQNIYQAPPQQQPVQQTEPANTGGGFSCNCGKVCGAMSSCAEAQYQLNVCGCQQRDADNDGIACDTMCQ